MEITNTQVAPAPRGRAEARRPYLMVIEGGQVGELHKLTLARTIVGRGADATLRLVDDGISREHAELVVDGDGGQLTVRDLGSTNGTFLNGARADGRPLRDGDKLSIGGATLLVFTHQDGIERDYQRGRARSAGRDPATDALKRDVFLERLGEEISFARRQGAPLTLLAWELDGFAALEDRVGPAAATALSAAAARAASGVLAEDDLLAVLDPGRFAVACRETVPREAGLRAVRLRAAIAAMTFPEGSLATDAPGLTASVGGAASTPGKDRGGAAASALLRLAETALSRARAQGGDRAELIASDSDGDDAGSA